MSFSNDVKNELARIDAAKACCTLAEIGGFVKACGVISPLGGDKLRLTMQTENSAVVRHYKTLFKEYFDVDPDVAIIKTNALNRQRRFSLITGMLDITFYRDDLSLLAEHPVINDTDIPFNITGRDAVDRKSVV